MFNKNSIFFTLGVGFVISVLLILFSFFTLIQKDHIQHKNIVQKRYSSVLKLVFEEYKRVGFTQPLMDVLNDMGFDVVEGENIYVLLENDDLKLIKKRRFQNYFVYILRGEDHNYIHISAPFDEYLLIDRSIPIQQYKYITVSIFLLVLIVFVLLSYKIYKKLYPLNELKEKIDNLGGDIEFKYIKESGKDEVSLLAKAFKEKSNSLKKVQESRNVFIRNIMHELKTPITKGRFLVELPNSDENKEKMVHVFYQMESLINEFASIEEVISRGDNIEKKEYFLSDVLDNVTDKLLLEEDDFTWDGQDIKLNINFKLFSIAVKNLIDNGIKYSDDKHIDIEYSDNKIIFKNKGKKLKYELEKYFEPFFNSESNGSDSFGLGFYIVNSILNAHDLNLEYVYEEGENHFSIAL